MRILGPRRKTLLAGIAISSALILLAAASLPFPRLKNALDGLMPDGDFETLTASTAVVGRAWLVLAAGLCALLAWAAIQGGLASLPSVQIP